MPTIYRPGWVEFSNNVIGEGFKFRDYFTTVETNNEPIDLRTMPDIKNIYSEIPEHEIKIDLNLLMANCPLL